MLFIDEIHRLSPVVEEILYPALEDYQIDIMIGEGPAARSIKLDLPPFTLVGATTRAGMLTTPLRDRFGIVARLEFYTPRSCTRIVQRSARLLDIADRRRRRARDRAPLARHAAHRQPPAAPRARLRRGEGATARITREVADAALTMLDVDPHGFDVMDRKLLHAVIEKFDGGPVGVDNLAAAIGEERDTIEDVIEPYLIQQGFLQRTPRGRVATRRRVPPLRPRQPQVRRHARAVGRCGLASGSVVKSEQLSIKRLPVCNANPLSGRCAFTTKTPTPAASSTTPTTSSSWSARAPSGCARAGFELTRRWRKRARRRVRGALARDRISAARALQR